MITNFFKSGLSSLESISNKSLSSNPAQKASSNAAVQPLLYEKIVEDTLNTLIVILNEKLGEPVDGSQFKQLTQQLLQSKRMEVALLETKQKYNDLVNKSSVLSKQARRISNSLGQFIASINLFLESQQLMVPLQQIQRGVNQLNSERVEKQFNYLIKIFTNNFQEVIDKNVKLMEKSKNQEIKAIRNLNKNLENEIVNIKGSKNNDESKYLQQALKITSLNEKIAKLNSQKSQLEKQLRQGSSTLQNELKIISEQEALIKQLQNKEFEQTQKLRQYQLKSLRVEKQTKQKNSQSEQLSFIIQKLKQRQEQAIQELQSEHRRKQIQHQSQRKKLFNEKVMLQERIDRQNEKINTLEEDLAKKNQQVNRLNKELNRFVESRFMEIDLDKISSKEEEKQSQKSESEVKQTEGGQSHHKMTLQEIMARMNSLQIKNRQLMAALAKEQEVGVNKQVLRDLFLSYDDQSKQWSIRRNIKYQIYTLLDLKHKMPKPEEPKNSKWFGFF